MYNLDDSIRGFARACLNFGLRSAGRVYLSTKIHPQDLRRRFKDIFRTCSQRVRRPLKAKRITYEHRLIDDMVGLPLKWSGAFVWPAKLRRDVQSDTVAQGSVARPHDSVAASPDGRR